MQVDRLPAQQYARAEMGRKIIIVGDVPRLLREQKLCPVLFRLGKSLLRACKAGAFARKVRGGALD